jgi:hypothetical protein
LSTAGEYDLWSYMLASLWTIGKEKGIAFQLTRL